MVGNSSYVCGSIIVGIAAFLLQACLQITVVATIATEDNHYHPHNMNSKHNEQQQPATTTIPRKRRRRRAASNNDDCAWHADMITRDGCTNDDNYEQDWLKDRITIEHMFYSTPQECCQSIFRTSNCPTYTRTCTTNVLTSSFNDEQSQQQQQQQDDTNTNVVLPKEKDCVTPGWHPDSQTQDGCTNSNTYPTQFNSVAQRHKIFFETYEDCCSSSYFVGVKCNKYNVGCTIDDTLPTCDSNVWHSTYGNDGEGCSNTPVDKQGIELFNSAQDCCDMLLKSGGGQCSVVDGCSNDITYLMVTKRPTMRPTDRPTQKPTQLPTTSPTLPPTTSPTIRPPSYYMVHSSDWKGRGGTCLNELITPKPYYTTTTFDNIVDCCNQSFDKQKCFDHIDEEDMLLISYNDDEGEGEGGNITTCTTFNVTDIDETSTITKCTTVTNITVTTCTTTTTATGNKLTEPQSTKTPPTYAPTMDCSVYKWHMSTIPSDPSNTCTNDEEYPKEWLDNNAQFFLHDTIDECCQMFGGNCEIRDWCGDLNRAKRDETEDDGGDTNNITNCITTNITEPTYSPTLLPTLSPVLPDTIVDITMYGTLDIYNLPSLGYDDRQLKSLKKVFDEMLTLVMSHSHLVHPTEIDVDLLMYGYTGLRNSRRRERELLGSLVKEVEHNNSDNEMDNNNNNEEHAQQQVEGRRRTFTSYGTTPQTLAYEMKAPMRCDYKCQRLIIGHPGQRAFYELEKQYQYYIETGLMSSSLNTVGKKYYYYLPIFDTTDSNNEDAPLVSSGTLTYRLGVESYATWVPTLTPTMYPSNSLIPKPSGSPTKSYEPSSQPTVVASDMPSSLPTTECSSLKWHYIQGQPTGTCTNSPNYPSLWDVDTTIGSYFLFDSLEECCSTKSPNTCIVSDTCFEEHLLKPSSYCHLKELKYHPTTPSQRTCTNSEDYPPAWNDMDGFMFDNPVDCCTKYYPTGLCLIKSICY